MSTDWLQESRRSLRAWVRTGVALIVVGALVVGSSLALGATTSADRLRPWIGVVLGALGIVSIAGAMLGHRRARARGGRMSGASESAARVVAGVIAIAGSLLIVLLIAEAC